jgi:hypothetical protein
VTARKLAGPAYSGISRKRFRITLGTERWQIVAAATLVFRELACGFDRRALHAAKDKKLTIALSSSATGLTHVRQ